MKKLLLLSGLVGAAIYVGAVILGGLLWPGYSHIQKAISELVSDYAPQRLLMGGLFAVYNLLLMAFGAGLLLKANSQPRGRMMGIIGSLVLTLLVGLPGVAMLIFSQDPTPTPTTVNGGLHLGMAITASFGTMIAIVLIGFWFRNFPELKSYALYSFVTVAIVFVSGGFTGAAMANPQFPFGLVERITIGTFIVWVFVVSFKLYQLEKPVAEGAATPVVVESR